MNNNEPRAPERLRRFVESQRFRVNVIVTVVGITVAAVVATFVHVSNHQLQIRVHKAAQVQSRHEQKLRLQESIATTISRVAFARSHITELERQYVELKRGEDTWQYSDVAVDGLPGALYDYRQLIAELNGLFVTAEFSFGGDVRTAIKQFVDYAGSGQRPERVTMYSMRAVLTDALNERSDPIPAIEEWRENISRRSKEDAYHKLARAIVDAIAAEIADDEK